MGPLPQIPQRVTASHNLLIAVRIFVGMPDDSFGEHDLFVSPDGDDGWSGTVPDAAEDDGPFATIERAIRVVRERNRTGEPLPETVWLRDGRYEIEEPIAFDPEDAAPVTYAAYPDEEPVISGGRSITGWEETTMNGVDVWQTTIPEVAAGDWYFRQLWVDGERCRRPRLPREGFYEVTDVPYDRDELWNAEGGISYGFSTDAPLEHWHARADVDVIIPHRWVQERSPIAGLDPDAGTVEMEFYAKMWLAGGERLAFENVRSALAEPGDWYLDRDTGTCTYVPRSGQSIEDVEAIAPVATQLLRIDGDPDDPVAHLSFEGITFAHAAWEYPARIDSELLTAPTHSLHLGDEAATSVQAQFVVPGTISLAGARQCSIRDCTIAHVGLYGLQLGEGCRANRVIGNELVDLGAGGIKVEGATVDGERARRTGHNHVTDNHIHAGGRVFPAGVGVLSRHAHHTTIAHNHIHDLYYSGISCGWSWGYGPCVDRDNHIEANHIHDIGQELLSDMGGIYTLGVQPGTRLRRNHIHDVNCYDYGGWAIYPDEGSSHLIIEGNVCHDTNRHVFHQHYGRENVVRHNVFANGAEGQITLSRVDDEQGEAFTVERNVVIADGAPIFDGGYACELEAHEFTSDLNVLWDRSGEDPTVAVHGEEAISWSSWRDRGFDRHSVVDDPLVSELEAGTPAFDRDSPVHEVGFRSFDHEDVGPRT